MQNPLSITRIYSLAERKTARESAIRLRDGFTLIELLVVAVIAAILMGLVMVALAGAQQDASVAKTRATIRKIDSIIQQRYEEYLYAPLDFVVGPASSLPPGYLSSTLPTTGPSFTPIFTDTNPINSTTAPESDAKIHARIRLQLIRNLMSFEMPDCPGDLIVLYGSDFMFRSSYAVPFSAYYQDINNVGINVNLTDSANYSQLQSKIISRAINFSSPGTPVYDGSKFLDITFLNRNFNAELLFLIVESTNIGGSSTIETFSNSEMGDTDGDGLRELLDAWGKPIQWLRWPAGYNDDAETSQLGGSLKMTSGGAGNIDRYSPDPADKYVKKWNDYITAPPIEGDDQFDPSGADLGYRTGDVGDAPRGTLRPLIVSAGIDGQFGLRFLWTGSTYAAPMFSLSDATANISGSPYSWPDPYFPRPFSPGYAVGQNQSLGGVQNVSIDAPNAGNVDLNVAVGVTTTGFFYDPEFTFSGGSVGETNRLIRESVADNVNNFDETGGSL